MSIPPRPRLRILIATETIHQREWMQLFARVPLVGWETRFADRFDHAHHVMHNQPCHAILVAGDVLQREGRQRLVWLTMRESAPVILVGDDGPELFADAYEHGVAACLPLAAARSHPPLLDAVLRHAVRTWTDKAEHGRLKRRLADADRHVDRLVQTIWRISPCQDNRWYPQRHMLERLQEELTRCQRHRLPLSLAVGQLRSAADATAPCLPDWAAEAILRGKRRCDVVGQYGPDGFMVLMVHTPKPGGVTCCHRLQSRLEHSAQELDGPRVSLQSFFGIASIADEQYTPQTLLRVAEQNLETAQGRAGSSVVAD